MKLHIKHASNLLTAAKQLTILSKIDRKLAINQVCLEPSFERP